MVSSSCQPVTIKNRDKIHEKVGFMVKNRDIVKKLKLRDKNGQNYQIWGQNSTVWTFKLLRKNWDTQEK